MAIAASKETMNLGDFFVQKISLGRKEIITKVVDTPAENGRKETYWYPSLAILDKEGRVYGTKFNFNEVLGVNEVELSAAIASVVF